MTTSSTSSSPSSPSTSSTTPLSSIIDESLLEQRLFEFYNCEVKRCDDSGQSTQHIGDEWMRRHIRQVVNFDVSDRWIKMFRRKHGIRYFSGRRHSDKVNKLIPLSALDATKVKTSNYLKARRTLRNTRSEYEDVDKLVKEEIDRRQIKGERLTNPWIKEYAQNLACEMYPGITGTEKLFDANWLYRFKRRNAIELKPRGPDEKSIQALEPIEPILIKDDREDKSQPEDMTDEKASMSSEADEVPPDLFQLQIFQQYLSLLNGGGLGFKEEEN